MKEIRLPLEKPVVADEPGGTCGGGGAGHTRPAGGYRRRRRGGPSRAPLRCARSNTWRWRRASAGGWVGAVLQDQEAKRIAAPRRKRKWSVRPTGSEAGAMVVSWLWMLLRPAAVRRVPPVRLTALLSWVLFLSSYPILTGRLRRRRDNSSGVIPDWHSRFRHSYRRRIVATSVWTQTPGGDGILWSH